MVKASLTPVRKTTVVDGILEQIKGLIRGRAAGDRRLPSERDLAVQFGVSRPSVREALRTLELMGVVDTRHGSGSQLAGSGSNVLKAPFEFLIALDQPSIADLHETRQVLEIHLAGRAALRRTDSDLEAMREALDAMKSHLARPKDVTEHDLRFHQAVATASHNRVLERVMHGLHANLHSMMDAAWPGTPDMKTSFKVHVQVFDAIRRRRPEAARRAMGRHMEILTVELRQVRLIL